MAEQQLPEDLVPIAGDPEPLAPVEDAVLSEAPTEAIEPTEANILDEERRKSRAARFNVPLAALTPDSGSGKGQRKSTKEPQERQKKYFLSDAAALPDQSKAMILEVPDDNDARKANRAKRFKTVEGDAEKTNQPHTVDPDAPPADGTSADNVQVDGFREEKRTPAIGTAVLSEAFRTSETDEIINTSALCTYGCDDMSTEDLFRFFLSYNQRPSFINWIDDSSCNVVFNTPEEARAALLQIAVFEDDAADLIDWTQPDEYIAWRAGRPFKYIIQQAKADARQRREHGVGFRVTASPTSRRLSFRFATNLDKRPPKGQRKPSEYYKKTRGEIHQQQQRYREERQTQQRERKERVRRTPNIDEPLEEPKRPEVETHADEPIAPGEKYKGRVQVSEERAKALLRNILQAGRHGPFGSKKRKADAIEQTPEESAGEVNEEGDQTTSTAAPMAEVEEEAPAPAAAVDDVDALFAELDDI